MTKELIEELRDAAIDTIAGGTISVPGGYGVLHGDDAANIVDAIIQLVADALAAVPDAATERERSDLWQSLDWMLWGVGMGDVFREPLADKMIRSLSDEEFDKAQDLIRGWDKLRGGLIERNLFVELKAERDAATAAVERVRAVLSNDELVWSDGSYTNVLVVEVKDVLAALDGAPDTDNEPEEMYQAGCGSWDCRAPECGKA